MFQVITKIEMNKKITALKVQKKNQQRVNVYLDSEFAFGLSRIVASRLHIGQELDDDKIVQLKDEDEQEINYQRAIRFLGYRIRSNSEIKKHLELQGTSEDIIDSVVNRLERNGLLDDKQFAQLWVENRNEFRPRSHRMLFVELNKKGIHPDVINQVLDDTSSDEELVFKAAENQVRKYRNLDWRDFRRKLSSYLARRGFSYAVINPVVNQIWAERDSENPPGLIEQNNFG
jgi:regulatory protein